MTEIPEGKILLNTTTGKQLGFTSDLFSADSYLWRVDKSIWVSLIFSKRPGEGNFKKLVNNILEVGFTVIVPTPSNQMRQLLERWDFITTFDYESGCEILVKESNAN